MLQDVEVPKYYVTWDEVEIAIAGLVSKFNLYKYKPRRILALARGGLIPATMLSHKLGIRQLDSIRTVGYKLDVVSPGKRNTKILQPLDIMENASWHHSALKDLSYWDRPDTLVVDDLWDTGQTIAAVKEMLPEAVYCTAFYRDPGNESFRIVNYPGLCLSTRDWIVFPWEQ